MRAWLVCVVVLAPVAATARCYDFSWKVVTPRRPVPPLEKGAELREVGTLRSGAVWAVVRSQVNKPIKRVYELLLDHEKTKDPRTDEAITALRPSPHYLALQEVRFLTSPLPLIDIRWLEVWAFALTRGTPEAPEEVVVSYEKTEGTSYIESMCGSVVLRRTGEATTDLFWFEEAKISSHSAEETRDGIAAVIRLLQEAK